jgi:hypothetical protein
MAFFTPMSEVFDPAISSEISKLAMSYIPCVKLPRLTSNKRINSGGQRNQNTKTLGSPVAQSLACGIGQTTGECTLELGQERLDSQWNLLQ